VASEASENRAAGCAQCADSNSTLKEQIVKLDNIELKRHRKYRRLDGIAIIRQPLNRAL
jgi:glutaredoxin